MFSKNLLSFNYDHGLSLGPQSCMCNFGIEYAGSIGHSGHLSLARRVLPDRPGSEWPLVHWDEEEQEGTTFAVSDARWLSGWLANFPGWEPEKLARERAAVEAAAAGDAAIGPVIDAILAGERDSAKLYAIAAPGSLLARTHALAKQQGIELGRPRWRGHSAEDAAAWDALAAEDPRYNAPLAYALACEPTPARAREWLRRNLKFDVGGSIGVSDLTRAAARAILAHEPDPSSPWWPVLSGLETADDVGGDPWCEVGQTLLARGEALEAITAFENAILFERGWSEEYHMDAFAGLQRAAKVLGAPAFLAYLEAMGED